MQLTLQLFEQVAAMLKSDEMANRDKRFAPRVGLRVRAQITPIIVDDKGSRPIDVWVRDISAGGIGLTSQVPLPKGTLFIIKLPDDAMPGLSLQYKVAYVNTIGGSCTTIGAIFQQVISKSNDWQTGPLKLLGGKKKKPAPAAA